jgi:hypothetical protein
MLRVEAVDIIMAAEIVLRENEDPYVLGSLFSSV